MKLAKLKKAIKKVTERREQGERLKAKKLRKTLEGLKQKRKKFEKDYAGESSAAKKEKLKLKIKIVKAQIKKGSILLKNLDS